MTYVESVTQDHYDFKYNHLGNEDIRYNEQASDDETTFDIHTYIITKYSQTLMKQIKSN